MKLPTPLSFRPSFTLTLLAAAISLLISSQANAARTDRGHGTYPMIETSFSIPNLQGDPFDPDAVDVEVNVRRSHGSAWRIPAFFDGGSTWRVRMTPDKSGHYTLGSITLNGQPLQPADLQQREWTVAGASEPGFVRIRRGRFAFDDGTSYFPLGHDQAWRSNHLPDIPDLFAKMHTAGENWSRVWMNHWDGKNLDWPAGGPSLKPGEIDLNAARRWDSIVNAAAKNGIYFQMTLQHHGQYSTTTDSNWNQNPYNAKNGGFLQDPADFFTNDQARTLTRRKLRYILARWGYSPNIMAFELFNEVQYTDAAHKGRWNDVAAWHQEMAAFLRQHDLYHHLITTSSVPEVPQSVWAPVDYLQRHSYPPDILVALSNPSVAWNTHPEKPLFVGEFGPQNLKDTDGVSLHNGLWASLMSGTPGAAQYWSWDVIEQYDLYPLLRAGQRFVAATGLGDTEDWTRITPVIESQERSDLRFAPGGGWGTAVQTEFTVEKTGPPAGVEKFPSFLQGNAHRSMIPGPLTLHVNNDQAGSFILRLSQIAKAGADVRIGLDGQFTQRDFPAAGGDYAPSPDQGNLQVDLPAGSHTITVENTGKDWVVIHDLVFTHYTAALGAMGLVGRQSAVFWVYHRANVDAPLGKETDAATGRLLVSGLPHGHYRVTWWDTRAGEPLKTDMVYTSKGGEGAAIDTPLILRDAAVYLVKIPG